MLQVCFNKITNVQEGSWAPDQMKPLICHGKRHIRKTGICGQKFHTHSSGWSQLTPYDGRYANTSNHQNSRTNIKTQATEVLQTFTVCWLQYLGFTFDLTVGFEKQVRRQSC